MYTLPNAFQLWVYLFKEVSDSPLPRCLVSNVAGSACLQQGNLFHPLFNHNFNIAFKYCVYIHSIGITPCAALLYIRVFVVYIYSNIHYTGGHGVSVKPRWRLWQHYIVMCPVWPKLGMMYIITVKKLATVWLPNNSLSVYVWYYWTLSCVGYSGPCGWQHCFVLKFKEAEYHTHVIQCIVYQKHAW